MAHIFKHKESNKLYTIEHFLVDLHFADCGSRTGIYATPYKWKGEVIKHTKGQARMGGIDEFNPKKFVAENFDIVGELW